MTVQNYSTLNSDLETWMENNASEFTDQIPYIITDAQSRMARDLQVVGFATSSTFGVSTTVTTFSRPTDYLVPRVVTFTISGSEKPMQKREITFVKEYNSATSSGPPEYYAVLDAASFAISPPPDQAYSGKLYYLGRPAALNSSNLTNYYTDFCYDVLRACCLAQAARFVLDDRQVSLQTFWEGYYKEGVSAINALEIRSERDEFRRPTVTDTTP